MSLRSTAGLIVITVVCLVVPLVAQAYGTAETLPRFWTGALLLAIAPIPLVASIGLGVTVAFASATAAWLSICAAGLGAFHYALVKRGAADFGEERQDVDAHRGRTFNVQRSTSNVSKRSPARQFLFAPAAL